MQAICNAYMSLISITKKVSKLYFTKCKKIHFLLLNAKYEYLHIFTGSFGDLQFNRNLKFQTDNILVWDRKKWFLFIMAPIWQFTHFLHFVSSIWTFSFLPVSNASLLEAYLSVDNDSLYLLVFIHWINFSNSSSCLCRLYSASLWC